MLEVNNVDVYYGVIHALKNMSLRVEKGEIVTLIGANGAGKTTTLRTISGLIKPSKGSLHLKVINCWNECPGNSKGRYFSRTGRQTNFP